MEGSLKIVTEGGTGEVVEKKSRFIASIFPIQSEEEALTYLSQVRKKYYDARHNCFAYVVGEKNETERCSDDGEPSGTAGRPMMDVLTGQGLHNVLVVVTRYFGGTLLGTGGLVRAYARSAKDALDAAGMSVVRRWVAMEAPCTYGQFEEVRREVLRFGGVEEQVDYGADVVLSVLIPEERAAPFAARLLDASAGTIEVLEAGEQLRDVPWKKP